jgi:hypothetical protein
MARKASVPPSPAQLTPQQVRASIPKLERRAAELRALDVDRLTETTYVAPPNCGGLNSTHIHGTHVPVEEPSTASIADNR